MNDRLQAQRAFLDEAEKLKLVARRNRIVDRARFENSAEHSWHVALAALVLAEHADAGPLDLLKVVRMLLVHDLVEIRAGDTWLFDDAARAGQGRREAQAAETLFGLLPPDQAARWRSEWQEFEACESPEATYAGAIDALQPLCNHLLSGAAADDPNPPARTLVHARKRDAILGASARLWSLAESLIDDSTARGLYRDG